MIRFEYCSAVGQEVIKEIARTMKGSLKELSVVRNFTEKIARIGDQAI